MIKSLRPRVCLLILLCGFSVVSQAQTITAGNLSAAFVCPSGTLSVPFSATGPFGAGNVFSAQLSDASGTFPATANVIGTLTANPASTTTLTISATIPAGTAVSAAYKVRVVSSVGGKIGVSSSVLSVGTAAPTAPATAPTFCQNSGGQTVTATGQNLQWYATNTALTAAGAGATFPVSTTAAGNFSLFVSQTVNGCESVRTQVNYTVTATPAAPTVTALTICQGQSVGALTAGFSGGATQNWYGTSNSGGTASSAAPTPSNTTSNTYYVSQSVNGCESARVGLAVTVKPALAAPIVNVPPPYCTNSAAYPVATATGTNLQWYNALGTPVGSSAPILTVAGSYTYSVTQSDGTCTSPRITYVVTIYPKADAPTLTTVAYCSNTPPASLAVTGTNLQWFTNAAGTTATTQPAPPTTTQTFYVQQTNGNGCKSDVTPLTVVVNAQPSAPVVTPNVAICAGTTATLTATALPGNSLRWYGSNPQGSFSTSPVFPSTAGIQYVSQVTGSGCESDKAQINVSVNPAPAVPATTTPTPFCTGQSVGPLSATVTVTGGTLRWYTDANTPTFTTTAPAASNQSSNTYYVAQVDQNGCVSTRVGIGVTVKPRPGTPGLTAAQSQVNLCQNQTSQGLTASLTNGTSLNWYDATGNLLGGAPAPPTTGIGTTSYQVAQVLDGCEGSRVPISVTVYGIPAAPAVTAVGPYCQGTSIPALQASGSNLRWYGANSSGGAATGSQTPDNNASNTYYVTQTVNNCESPRGSVAVQIKPTPGLPGTTPVEFCQNTSAPTLTATPIPNAILNWYGTNAGGASVSNAPTPPNNTATTYTYYVSQTLDGCEGVKAQLSVRVKPTPGVPGTSPVAYCNGQAAQPLTASGQNLVWYDPNDAQLGNAPTPNTGSVGTQVYRVTQSQEGCVSGKATLPVTINALPAAPGTTNLQYCLPTQDQPVQNVGALTANGQNLRWYNPDGNAYGQTPVPPISGVQVITYQVTQTVNNCEGPKATLQVTVQTTAAPVTPKPLVTYCRNDVATPLEATGTNLRWIDPNNNLLPANTTPTPPTTNATRPGGAIYQVYQTGGNGCVSPRATIKLVINTNPTLALLGSTAINLGQTTALQLRFTGAPPFAYVLSNGASGTVTTDTTALVTVTPLQTTTYQVTSVSNVCGIGAPGAPATATITVATPTIQVGNLNSSTLCAGSNFSIPFTTQGTFNLSQAYQAQLVLASDTSGRNPVNLASGTGSPLVVSIPSATAGGRYAVRIVRTVSTSPLIQVISSNSPTALTVRPLPTATLTGTQNIYEGSPGSLTVTFGGDGPWTFSFADSTRTTPVTTTNNPYLIAVQPLKTATYRLTAVSNNCGTGTVSGTTVVTVLPLLAVQDDPLSNVVKAYPIPATTTITVAIDRPLYTESALLDLTDLNGHSVQQRTTRQAKTDLDLSSHPAGLYILTITVGDQRTTRKILKQ